MANGGSKWHIPWLSVEANNLGYRLQKEEYGTEYAYAVPFEFEVP